LQYPPVDLVELVVADFCHSSLSSRGLGDLEHLALGRDAFQQIIP